MIYKSTQVMRPIIIVKEQMFLKNAGADIGIQCACVYFRKLDYKVQSILILFKMLRRVVQVFHGLKV